QPALEIVHPKQRLTFRSLLPNIGGVQSLQCAASLCTGSLWAKNTNRQETGKIRLLVKRFPSSALTWSVK
ncbi:MAG: hypothetical protein QM428_02470, partial [Verrucomicrobiota bacterium]|nr:hypothetical protein [Verrucomicrobiota bacterium]